MIKKNQLVMMLALLSATPHLTLWAVESNQGPKKVSATRLDLNGNEGDSMTRSKMNVNTLLINMERIGENKYKCAETMSSEYRDALEVIVSTFNVTNNAKEHLTGNLLLMKSLLPFEEGIPPNLKASIIKGINGIEDFLKTIAPEISNFNNFVVKEWAVNGINKLTSDMAQDKDNLKFVLQNKPQPQNNNEYFFEKDKQKYAAMVKTENFVEEDKNTYIDLLKIFRDTSTIDLENSKDQSVVADIGIVPYAAGPQDKPNDDQHDPELKIDLDLKDDPLKYNLEKLTNIKENLMKVVDIRENLMRNNPDNYAQYESYKLATEKLSACFRKFNNICDNFIKKWNNLNK